MDLAYGGIYRNKKDLNTPSEYIEFHKCHALLGSYTYWMSPDKWATPIWPMRYNEGDQVQV